MLAFGVGMIQVDEYLVAMLCWFIAVPVLIAKAIHWEGLKDRPVLTGIGRGAWLCGSVLLLILLCYWTEIKRGDKPFSILIARIAKSESVSPAQSCCRSIGYLRRRTGHKEHRFPTGSSSRSVFEGNIWC